MPLAECLNLFKAVEKRPFLLHQEMTRSRLKFGVPTDHSRLRVDVTVSQIISILALRELASGECFPR